MAIIGEDVVYLTVRMTQNGQVSVTNFKYYPVNPGDVCLAVDFVTTWDAQLRTLIKALMSENTTLESVYGKVVGPSADNDYTLFIGEVGVVTGDVLPPQAAFSFRKSPDNSEIEGSNLNPFRIGGWRWFGVAESRQNNGVLGASALAAAQAVADSIVIIDDVPLAVGTGDYLMYMDRPPLTELGPPQSAAPVVGASIRQFVGSQNTRKLF